MAATGAERQRAYIERLKAGIPPARKARDRRSRPKRWTDAIGELFDCLNEWETTREALPTTRTNTAYAARLDAVLELRDLVEQLDAADLPLGFGRDRRPAG